MCGSTGAFVVIGVRALGPGRRTLVAFTADHGEEFFAHGRGFHGQRIYGDVCPRSPPAGVRERIREPGATP